MFNLINRGKAELFLRTLDPEANGFTFQTFTDSKKSRDSHKHTRTGDPLARILHGSLDQNWNVLVELSKAGAGIYVTINKTDFRGRSASNIISVRAYFVDLDGAPLANLRRLQSIPHLFTQTSRGRFQVFWRVIGGRLQTFAGTQSRLATLLGGDPSVCDLPRVMRLPGFPHQKDQPSPVDFVVKEIAPYPEADFQKRLADAEAAQFQDGRRRQGAAAIAGIATPPNMTQGFPDGQRTDELTKRAGWCLGPAGNMTEAETLKACLAWNRYNKPPLTDDKVRKTVANIAKAEAKKRATATSITLFHTDLGNAQRLVKCHGENIRFVPEWQKWIIWSGNRWEVDNDGAVVRLAKQTVTVMYSEALKIANPSQRDALIRHALKSQAEPRLNAMVSLAESEIEVVLSAKALDSHRWLLGVQNGVVELKTGRFRTGQREDFITKQAGVSYDPNARCPEWLKFLDTIMGGDASLKSYIQRVIGYTLTGFVGEEVMFVLYGIGNNGKSTFRETCHALLGDYAIAADASLLIERKTRGGPTEEIARLAGRRFVAVNETNENDRLQEARVKFVTSQDTITARNLYGHFFDFFPTHKAIVATNHKPIVRGTDEGIWRRLHLIPFTVTIPKSAVEKHFRERRLMPELAGILNWAIDGVRAYLKEGLNPPAAVRAATDEYRHDMDVVGQWIEERCVRHPGANTPSKAAYKDYEFWAEDEIGWTLSQVRWRRTVSEHGFEAAKGTHGERIIRGLRLKFNPTMIVTPGRRSSPPAG